MNRLGLATVDPAPPVKRFFMRQAMGLVDELLRLVKGEALSRAAVIMLRL